jgi:hypothetical protein
VTEGVLLDALATQVQLRARECDDVERILHRDRVGQRCGGGVLRAAETVHRHNLDPIRKPWSRAASQPVIAAAERPETTSSSRAGP